MRSGSLDGNGLYKFYSRDFIKKWVIVNECLQKCKFKFLVMKFKSDSLKVTSGYMCPML